MKLTCDLCGSELQMNAGGQSATCSNCGLEYSRERLLEMLNGSIPAEPVVVPDPVVKPAQPKMRNFYMKRKFNLSGCAAKAAVFLDGQPCAILTARGEACVPISEGDHEVSVRIGVYVLESLKFTVRDRDVMGLLYLDQKAFSAQFVFEISQL